MKCYVFVILFLSFNLVVSGQKQEAVKTLPSLTLEVENGRSLKLTTVDIAKLPRRELKAKDHEKEASYSGVELREILRLAEVKLGAELRGSLMAAYVVIEAADGYKVVFGIAELDSGFTDKPVILADAKDSKPLTEKDGMWKIIVPDDKRPGRWVRQVTAIRVKFAK